MENLWYGFEKVQFSFQEREAILVLPHQGTEIGRLALKTEYWGAYPDVEIQLLKRGFHVAILKNKTRFATKEDCDAKAEFVKFLAEKYGLSEKCVPIGYSCGGAHAIRFAGFYPELISCVFVDAPVLNYNDFPGRLGDPECEKVWEKEFVNAYPGIKRYQLVNFSEHPLNMADALISNKIPVIMVYGEEDRTVFYEKNGKLLEFAMEGTDLLKVVHVRFRGHHPHGKIGNNTEIVQYIVDHCCD